MKNLYILKFYLEQGVFSDVVLEDVTVIANEKIVPKGDKLNRLKNNDYYNVDMLDTLEVILKPSYLKLYQYITFDSFMLLKAKEDMINKAYIEYDMHIKEHETAMLKWSVLKEGLKYNLKKEK